jgi:hypothetical protein
MTGALCLLTRADASKLAHAKRRPPNGRVGLWGLVRAMGESRRNRLAVADLLAAGIVEPLAPSTLFASNWPSRVVMCGSVRFPFRPRPNPSAGTASPPIVWVSSGPAGEAAAPSGRDDLCKPGHGAWPLRLAKRRRLGRGCAAGPGFTFQLLSMSSSKVKLCAGRRAPSEFRPQTFVCRPQFRGGTT